MGAFMQIFSGKFLANTKLNEILFNECLHFLIANKEILKQYFVSNICIKLFAFNIESKLFCMPYYGMRFACYGMRFVSYGMKFKCFAIVHVVEYTLKLIVALCIYPTFRCFTRSYFLLGLRHGVVVSTVDIQRNSSKKSVLSKHKM